jgi:hypothetical protein
LLPRSILAGEEDLARLRRIFSWRENLGSASLSKGGADDFRGPGVGRVLYWFASTIAFVIFVFAIYLSAGRKGTRSCTSWDSQLQLWSG